jgi:hypothetical protein
MRPRRRPKPTLPLLCAVLLFPAALGWSKPASAQVVVTPWPGWLVYDFQFSQCVLDASQTASWIERCMQGVMWPRTLDARGRPVVTGTTAASICRGARTELSSRTIPQCMRSLLYTREGLGTRRADMPEDAAALACQFAHDERAVQNVADCMRRMMFDRGGLGRRRRDMSAHTAAQACRGVAPQPAPFFFAPVCIPPSGEQAVRVMDECVRRLTRSRAGLGSPRPEVSADDAVIACQGALSWYP